MKDGFASVPEEIKELWGRPPILPSENVETYYLHAAQLATTVKPKDFIEWLLVRDTLDLTWDIRRVRRFKADIIECKEVNCGTPRFSPRKRTDKRDDEAEEARLFFENLKDFELIERMLAGFEARRTKILSDIEGRRVDLAWQLRKASDNIIEGEFGARVDAA
jgi:hypothetical protein